MSFHFYWKAHLLSYGKKFIRIAARCVFFEQHEVERDSVEKLFLEIDLNGGVAVYWNWSVAPFSFNRTMYRFAIKFFFSIKESQWIPKRRISSSSSTLEKFTLKWHLHKKKKTWHTITCAQCIPLFNSFNGKKPTTTSTKVEYTPDYEKRWIRRNKLYSLKCNFFSSSLLLHLLILFFYSFLYVVHSIKIPCIRLCCLNNAIEPGASRIKYFDEDYFVSFLCVEKKKKKMK